MLHGNVAHLVVACLLRAAFHLKEHGIAPT